MADVKNDFWGVLLDETKFFNIAPEDRRHIESIMTLYVFDRSERTYVAEMTPSYFLVPVWTTVRFKDVDLDEDTRSDLDEKYSYEGSDDTYMHLSAVERFIKRNPKRVVQYGYAEEGVDEVVEEYSANWPL